MTDGAGVKGRHAGDLLLREGHAINLHVQFLDLVPSKELLHVPKLLVNHLTHGDAILRREIMPAH